MNSPLVRRPEGLYFVPGDFYIDPQRAVARAVISHGHADHAIASNEEVWCTRPTSNFMKMRYKDRLKSSFHTVAYREPFHIGAAVIQFYPAGHILGSAQIIIDYNGKRYCYTGDFKLRPDCSCEPFEVVPCDVLITETTFAHPDYSHPTEEHEFLKLEAYSHVNVVIGAYNLGKAQRITALAGKLLAGRRVMVHPEAAVFHRIYEQAGISLGEWQHYNYRLFNRTRGNILIAPPRAMSTYLNHVSVVTVFATGWKKSPFRSHFNFHLSDHADWSEILQLIEKTGATQIMTVHGDGSSLINHLKMERPLITCSNLTALAEA
ncbi:MAG: MBL fold metallo-hydrolase [Bacteroidota bacterium]|nr:MBL fold metallo-hydrolase [Bacteroidota bacterium]